MPIRPPALDDRSFHDLVADMVRRIPAHTPDWTDIREGDPGHALIDLLAWMGDTILYRVNLIPERQRLAFLRLLGKPLRPAMQAHGLVQVTIDDPEETGLAVLPMRHPIPKPVHFELDSPLVHGRELFVHVMVQRDLRAASVHDVHDGHGGRVQDLPRLQRTDGFLGKVLPSNLLQGHRHRPYAAVNVAVAIVLARIM